MFVTKKKFNKIIENINECKRDIGRLEREVLGNSEYPFFPVPNIPESKVAQSIKKINEHTYKLKALMRHFKLDFKGAPEYEVVPKPEEK